MKNKVNMKYLFILIYSIIYLVFFIYKPYILAYPYVLFCFMLNIKMLKIEKEKSIDIVENQLLLLVWFYLGFLGDLIIGVYLLNTILLMTVKNNKLKYYLNSLICLTIVYIVLGAFL